VPNETRKSFEDGTTIFERVLPGADRMYPDTDSPPIPLPDEYISTLSENLPQDVIERYRQLRKWNVPESNDTYIFKRNLFPLVQKIVSELEYDPRWLGRFFGQEMKHIEGTVDKGKDFNYDKVFDLLNFMKQNKISSELAPRMLKVLYHYPKMDFESILNTIKFKKYSEEEIVSKIPFLKDKFAGVSRNPNPVKMKDWVMGQLLPVAMGNISLSHLAEIIKNS
jgi:glutamyl-tRNA(Gln) amidotransferase subunit E